MKKLVLFLVVALCLGSQKNEIQAGNYLHWIYWTNSPNGIHVASAEEMVGIILSLSRGEIQPNAEYHLSTGTNFKIPKPDLYLKYLKIAFRAADPTITDENFGNAVTYSEAFVWDNNFSCKVRNYYYSSLHNRIQWIENYDGSQKEIPILVLNGCPVIKLDCGNPLEIYQENQPSPVPTTADDDYNDNTNGVTNITNHYYCDSRQNNRGNWTTSGVEFYPTTYYSQHYQPYYYYQPQPQRYYSGGYYQPSYGGGRQPRTPEWGGPGGTPLGNGGSPGGTPLGGRGTPGGTPTGRATRH